MQSLGLLFGPLYFVMLYDQSVNPDDDQADCLATEILVIDPDWAWADSGDGSKYDDGGCLQPRLGHLGSRFLRREAH